MFNVLFVIGALLLNGSAVAAPKQKATPTLTKPQNASKISKPHPVEISRAKYPEAAQHISDAQRQGHPKVLTVNRAGAAQNRKDSLAGYPTVKGKDRDEYPPASTAQGGKGASVRYMDPKDNRGAGSSMGHQMKNVPDGGKIRLRSVP